MCPGRHFAKQEVMAAIALVVLTFEVDFEEFVGMDGGRSERGPLDDGWYCGTAAMPPDRDMRVRLRRLE